MPGGDLLTGKQTHTYPAVILGPSRMCAEVTLEYPRMRLTRDSDSEVPDTHFAVTIRTEEQLHLDLPARRRKLHGVVEKALENLPQSLAIPKHPRRLPDHQPERVPRTDHLHPAHHRLRKLAEVDESPPQLQLSQLEPGELQQRIHDPGHAPALLIHDSERLLGTACRTILSARRPLGKQLHVSLDNGDGRLQLMRGDRQELVPEFFQTSTFREIVEYDEVQIRLILGYLKDRRGHYLHERIIPVSTSQYDFSGARLGGAPPLSRIKSPELPIVRTAKMETVRDFSELVRQLGAILNIKQLQGAGVHLDHQSLSINDEDRLGKTLGQGTYPVSDAEVRRADTGRHELFAQVGRGYSHVSAKTANARPEAAWASIAERDAEVASGKNRIAV